METIILRSQPELQIRWNQSEFQLTDASDPRNNGNYVYDELEDVVFHEGGTDWFISLLSFIMDIPTGGLAGGSKYKNKPCLKLRMKRQTFKVLLIDADLEKSKADLFSAFLYL